MTLFLKHLDLDETEMPSCDRTPPCTPKTPCSPFDLRSTNFCFRKGPETSIIYQPEGHPRQAIIDGDIWPPIFKPKHVRSAKAMRVEDDDVFIATYPKCGTTWLQHICHQLIRGENYNASEGNELCVQSPMIERMGSKFLETVAYPRILKTHFSASSVPKSTKAKYIYCVRNPKDCCTSYFHHNRNFKIYNFADGEWDTFVDLFLNGQLAFGDYFEHLLSWLPLTNEPNVLFLKYEDMLKDLEGSIYKIGVFLGGEARILVQDPVRLETVVRNSHIEAMKKDQKRWFPEAQLNKSEFIRKGGSGDWRNYFTKEQSDRMDARFRMRFAGTLAEGWWQEEMSWDPSPPKIHTLSYHELDDELGSLCRQGSFNVQLDFPKRHKLLTHCEDARLSEHGFSNGQDPHNHLAGRRCSSTSLLSSGYGSAWSLTNSHA